MKYSREQVMGTDRDSFKYRAFLTIISQNGCLMEHCPKEWEDLHTLQEFDFEIKLQGVEIDYIKFIERYANVFEMCGKDYERRIEERAREILKERFSRTMDAIDEVLNTTCTEQIQYIKENCKEEN
jgi:hypothetical protein